jgi:hypothetical protein
LPDLVGINSDGAVYYQSGDDWVWIPDAAAFAALGFNWSDIDWEDYLPSASSNPYSPTDNPPGAPAPPPGENPVGGNPPESPPASPPAAPSPTPAPAPTEPGSGLPEFAGIAAAGGPGSEGSAIYLLWSDGNYYWIPDATTFAALGGTLDQVVWETTLPAPVAGVIDPTTLAPAQPGSPSYNGPAPPDGGTEFGPIQFPGPNAGTGLPATYEGKITIQGQHALLIDALGNDSYFGILTAQTIAANMGTAVV